MILPVKPEDTYAARPETLRCPDCFSEGTLSLLVHLPARGIPSLWTPLFSAFTIASPLFCLGKSQKALAFLFDLCYNKLYVVKDRRCGGRKRE